MFLFAKTKYIHYLCSAKQNIKVINLINKVMATNNKHMLSELMQMAWQFVRKNGFTMSEALKTAWANFKLKKAMRKGIVRFYFRKVDGTIREAYGTLKESLLPPTMSGRKHNPTVQVYWDSEREGWRSFKKANVIFGNGEVC